jgi:hypothetical protein
MADWTTASVAIVSILATNGVVLWRDRVKSQMDATDHWWSTTGQAYLAAATSLRHYAYWISNVALAYGRKASGADPHFIAIKDADEAFGRASVEVSEAAELLDQHGSEEVVRRFKIAWEMANHLVQAKAKGLWPGPDQQAWTDAHSAYSSAFEQLAPALHDLGGVCGVEMGKVPVR